MTEQTEITKHTEQPCAESAWFRLFCYFRLFRHLSAAWLNPIGVMAVT